MLSHLGVLIALAMFWVASRYILIPNGRLRIAKIVFFLALGIYSMLMAAEELFPLVVVFQHTTLYFGAVFLVVSVVFGFLLEQHVYKIRQLVATTKAGVIFDQIGLRLSKDLQILWINDKYCQELLGYKSEALIGRAFEVIIHDMNDDTVRSIRRYIDDSLRTYPVSFKIRLVRKDFSRVWVLLALQKEISDGNLETIRGGIQNISEEVASREYLQLLRDMIDNSQVGVTITDAETRRILYTNAHDAAIHGYEIVDLLGEDVRMFAPDMCHVRNEEFIEKSDRHFSVNISKDGTIFPVILWRSRFYYGIESPRKAVATFCQRITDNPFPCSLFNRKKPLLLFALTETMTIGWVNDEVFSLFLDTQSRKIPTLSDVFAPEHIELLKTQITDQFQGIKKYELSDKCHREMAIHIAFLPGVGECSFLVGQLGSPCEAA